MVQYKSKHWIKLKLSKTVTVFNAEFEKGGEEQVEDYGDK